MTFDQLWIAVEKQNPDLETGSITLSSKGFKKAMELAYNQGFIHRSRMDSPKKDLGKEGKELFDSMFGGVFSGKK